MFRPQRLGALVILWVAVLPALAADVPTPADHLGYRAGADNHLAGWATVIDYFGKVDAASDRVLFRELGKTTEGRPYVVAVVSSPETIRDLGPHRDLQRRLALGTLEDDRAIESGKIAVLITCSIHSTETASTFMAMELLHELASRDDAATRELLDRVILLLVPSANPDGVDKVAEWYGRSKGKPWEGSGMPELYHKYAGHDTNRDWFMLNLKETQLLSRLLYSEWFPTITYDVHQMGSKGARLFVPPFYDPINPNLDPRLHQQIALVGARMASALATEGKSGVLTHAMYDNWWNGGNRTTPQRHNMVGILTEAASVRLATPIFLEKSELHAGARGFAEYKPATNFVDPWPGGWWRLRDIVDYELICARALLTLAARDRTNFQRNYRAMARDALKAGTERPPYGWVVPMDGDDPGRAAELVRTLRGTGIEVRRARAPFQAAGLTLPAGSYILPANQAYRAHLKDMMEPQRYPDRLTASGAAEPPYDVAGWTLPLQMGVEAITLDVPFQADSEPVETVEPVRGRIVGVDKPAAYVIPNRANDDFRVLNALFKAGVAVRQVEPTSKGEGLAAGTLMVEADDKARAVLDEVLTRASSQVETVGQEIPDDAPTLRGPRVGVYQPWVPSMDEGWTRLVLERFGFLYVTLHNAEIRAGRLRERLDVIVLPSIGTGTLRHGYRPDETEPEFVGGLEGEGAAALRAFVTQGGTLVCLEDSCPFAIEVLKLPVSNAVAGLKSSEFYGPGSIVGLTYDHRAGPELTAGMPDEGTAYFDRSLAFDLGRDSAGVRVAARYDEADVLRSGWLLGPGKIEGKPALVDVTHGRGRVVLFGFPPQHRGQPHGTFRLLFNALLLGGIDE